MINGYKIINDESYILFRHFIYYELTVQLTFKLFIGRFFVVKIYKIKENNINDKI